MPDRSSYLKEYYLKNRERIKQKNAKRYLVKKDEILVQSNNYYHQNKDKRAAWNHSNKEKLTKYFHEHYQRDPMIKKIRNREKRFKTYQITEKRYLEMFEEQDGKCLGCNRHQDVLSKRLCVDHCHTTGKIRGLLCTQCNLAIGLLDDNPEVLRNLTDYLERSKINEELIIAA